MGFWGQWATACDIATVLGATLSSTLPLSHLCESRHKGQECHVPQTVNRQCEINTLDVLCWPLQGSLDTFVAVVLVGSRVGQAFIHSALLAGWFSLWLAMGLWLQSSLVILKACQASQQSWCCCGKTASCLKHLGS